MEFNANTNTDIANATTITAKAFALSPVAGKLESELKFSKHAVSRLSDRNISLTDAQNVRLANGVKQASEKGITESLVLIDSLAFIVNIPNRTVVTALDQTETNSNIFTNIDGAVII